MSGVRYLVVLTAVLGTACVGKPPPTIAPVGARVRVTAPDLDLDEYDGRIAARTRDTITVDAVPIPVAALTRFDAYRGRKGNASTGAFVGALGGGLATLAIGAATCEDGFIFTKSECITLGTVFGLSAGAGLGAIIGAFIKTDRWERIPLDRVRMDVVTGHNGRVGVGVRLRL